MNNGAVLLPKTGAGGKVTYREWDVNDPIPGIGRDAERIVTGSDGSAYFTDNHFGTFIMLRGPAR